jgi:hypothetical protein
LREKSGKKPGGEKGHPGSTLAFSAGPDETIEYKPDDCSVCGRDLSNKASVFTGKCQVIDIPPIVPVITEHRIYSRQCSCGHCQVSGLVRSTDGATAFAIIRSVIDTAIKNSQNVWGALKCVAVIAE